MSYTRQVSYLLINSHNMLERTLSGRLGSLTTDLLSHASEHRERKAAKVWSAIKRNPTSTRNPLSLEHFWYLINSGTINFNNSRDVDTFCALLNNNSFFRELFIKLVLCENERDARYVKTDNALVLPARNLETVDLLALTTQGKEVERNAVDTLKFQLLDPVVMTRFVDRCSGWLVNLDVDILQRLLDKNHAAARFLNPNSFGIPYAHAPKQLQNDYNTEAKILGLLTRKVDGVPVSLALTTEQYYFATVLKFAFEYKPRFLKVLLADAAVDYPQGLGQDLQVIRRRIFERSPNLYLSSFLAGEGDEVADEHDHHHHNHHHEHAHNPMSKYFDLFIILCGAKYSAKKKIAGQKYSERLKQLLELRKDPLAYFIDLLHLSAPYQNVIDFYVENITTIFPIIAKSLDKNGKIAFNDIITREFSYDGGSINFKEVYKEKMAALIEQFVNAELSPRDKSELYAELSANLQNDTLRNMLDIEPEDIQALLDDPIYGASLAPFFVGLPDIQSIEPESVAKAYLLANHHWHLIDPRTRSMLLRIANWANQKLGLFEAYLNEEENKLLVRNRFFEARLMYEKTKKTLSFNEFLVDYALEHWSDELEGNEALARLIVTLSSGKLLAQMVFTTEAIRKIVMASPHLKAKLLDTIAVGQVTHVTRAMEILNMLIEGDLSDMSEYFSDENFRTIVAKVLQNVRGFDFKFLSKIAELDVNLFVEMLNGRVVEFARWLYDKCTEDKLNLLLKCSHKDFCVTVISYFVEFDEDFMYRRLEEGSAAFTQACANQPKLTKLLLDQSQKTRHLFYKQSFDSVVKMFVNGDEELGQELSYEVLVELQNITFKMMRHSLRGNGADYSKLIDRLFLYAPKFLFLDAQEEELWYLYKNISDIRPLFEPEFVADHKEAMVQLFCEHILEIDLDYWPVIFNDKESLEMVFTNLEDDERKRLVELLRECPNRSMFYQLVRMKSPALDGFLNAHQDNYSRLRERHAFFMNGKDVLTSSEECDQSIEQSSCAA